MYYEKPAVTFNIPGSGVNYVCIDGENGIEVNNRDVEKYAKALLKLADDESLRVKYGKNGKKRVLENFLNEQFEKILEIWLIECRRYILVNRKVDFQERSMTVKISIKTKK